MYKMYSTLVPFIAWVILAGSIAWVNSHVGLVYWLGAPHQVLKSSSG